MNEVKITVDDIYDIEVSAPARSFCVGPSEFFVKGHRSCTLKFWSNNLKCDDLRVTIDGVTSIKGTVVEIVDGLLVREQVLIKRRDGKSGYLINTLRVASNQARSIRKIFHALAVREEARRA